MNEDAKKLIVKVDEKSETIDIYGGDSGCTKDDPYWISFDRSFEPWVAHLVEKNWVNRSDLHEIERALNYVRGKFND